MSLITPGIILDGLFQTPCVNVCATTGLWLAQVPPRSEVKAPGPVQNKWHIVGAMCGTEPVFVSVDAKVLFSEDLKLKCMFQKRTGRLYYVFIDAKQQKSTCPLNAGTLKMVQSVLPRTVLITAGPRAHTVCVVHKNSNARY